MGLPHLNFAPIDLKPRIWTFQMAKIDPRVEKNIGSKKVFLFFGIRSYFPTPLASGTFSICTTGQTCSCSCKAARRRAQPVCEREGTLSAACV